MLPIASVAASAIGPLTETAITALAPATATESAGASFGDMVQRLASQTIDTLKNGEASAIAGVQGKVSTQNVVSAIMDAERNLHAMIALRDKAVSAYQEISHMAI